MLHAEDIDYQEASSLSLNDVDDKKRVRYINAIYRVVGDRNCPGNCGVLKKDSESDSSIDGEITMPSMVAVLEILQTDCNMNENAIFLDIGCGRGNIM